MSHEWLADHFIPSCHSVKTVTSAFAVTRACLLFAFRWLSFPAGVRSQETFSKMQQTLRQCSRSAKIKHYKYTASSCVSTIITQKLGHLSRARIRNPPSYSYCLFMYCTVHAYIQILLLYMFIHLKSTILSKQC